MATAARIILCLLGALVLMAGFGVTVAWWTAGTPANAASTGVGLVTNEAAATSAGSLLVDQLIDGADAATRPELEAQRDVLAAAAGRALQGVRAQVGEVIAVALTAVAQQTDVTISLKPILSAVSTELHAIDPRIPADIEDDATVEVKGSELGPVSSGVRALGFWWALLLIGLGILVGAAFAGRFGGWRRWRASGIALGVVAVIWLVVAFIAPGVVAGFADDRYQSDLIRAASSQVAQRIFILAGIALAIAIALIVMSIVRRGTVVATNPGPEPTPSATAVVEPIPPSSAA